MSKELYPLSNSQVQMSRRTLLWLIPLAFALHSLEEMLFFPVYLPLVLEKIPTSLFSLIDLLEVGEIWTVMQFGLVLTIAVSVGAVAWATLRPKSRLALGFVLVLTAGLLLNVLWHVMVGFLFFDGYTPGLITALLINLPLTLYILYRAATEHWMQSEPRNQ